MRQSLRRAGRAVASGTSVVLCALFMGGWARSRWVSDDVGYTATVHGTPQCRSLGFAHGAGDVAIIAINARDGDVLRPGWRHARLAPGPIRQMMPDRVIGMFGYGVLNSTTVLPGTYFAIVLPYWFLALLSALPLILTGLRYRLRRAARRIAAGLCPTCAYDLRASRGRCPECGAVAPGTPA